MEENKTFSNGYCEGMTVGEFFEIVDEFFGLPKESNINSVESKENPADELWIIAQLSDEYYVNRYKGKSQSKEETGKNTEKNTQNDVGNLVKKVDKILEIRIFNRCAEFKIFRTDIGKKGFYFRKIIDNDNNSSEMGDYFDEVQYLDIDMRKSVKISEADGHKVTATGGGEYFLPLQEVEDAKIRLRYYLGKYEETGQARIEDWRMVELINGKHSGNMSSTF